MQSDIMPFMTFMDVFFLIKTCMNNDVGFFENYCRTITYKLCQAIRSGGC